MTFLLGMADKLHITSWNLQAKSCILDQSYRRTKQYISKATTLCEQMERRTKRIDKDNLKMVMLKQDETFRDQVHELHRIYRVQKLLMSNAKNTEINATQTMQTQADCLGWNSETDRASYDEKCFDFLDQRHPSSKYRARPAGVAVPEEDEEESDLELTLATGGSCVRRRWPKAKEEVFTSESGSSFCSSSSTDSDVARKSSNEWGLNQKPDASSRFRKDTEETGISQEEDPKRSPWIFQLNLNLTA